MCVCKKHLHAHWTIQALIENAEGQETDLCDIINHETFFKYLTPNCQSEATTYISWN